MGSCLPWGSLPLVLFLLLQTMISLCSACSVDERAALLNIRSSLRRARSLGAANLWRKGGDDCCLWERVKCNDTIQRVSELYLANLYETDENDCWPLNSTVFSSFHELQYLDLSANSLCSLSSKGFSGLAKLRHLGLNAAVSGGNFPEFLSDIISLEVLALDYNQMTGRLPSKALGNLQNLRELSLSYNQFSEKIPASLFSLLHIEKLDLSTNFFSGPIPIKPSLNLSLSFKILRLSNNNLSGRLSFNSLQELTKLEEIDLSGNANLLVDVNIPGWIPRFQLKQLLLSGCDLDKSIIADPQFLRTQHHLEVLDLSSNNLSGNVPNWLFTEESTLHNLNLGNNSITGSLDPLWHTQSFLQTIDIRMNHVAGQLPANISSIFPSLSDLDISSNNFTGLIPTSLCEMSLMESLDLSNNQLSGTIPACVFTNIQSLRFLTVSNNRLGGLIFGGANNMSNIIGLYLDGNKFEGTIPHALSGVIHDMDLHDNELSGKFDTSFWDLPSLEDLNLAGNHITGEILPQFCEFTGISYLDLSGNNLTGPVPNCSFTQLNFLNLSGNSLSGDYFFNTSRLLALDIRHNQFTGNLHWVRYLDDIRLLFLGGNKFEGQITPNLCKLLHLKIIDLSHNKLSGSLPACIGNLSFDGDESRYDIPPDSNSLYGLSDFTFDTKGNVYIYGRHFFNSMSGIDLSANMLDGEIPWELGNLSYIKSLNLSYNFFVGPIPATFGSMEEIESLDLSHNMLSGPIPLQLTQLSSLGVFSVAYNNLSGCIPDSGQLGSFGMDSYIANTNLHKITQGNMCTPGQDPVGKEDVETPVDPVLYAITASAFVLAFWATVGFSFCHPYGRSVMLKL